MSFNNDTFNPLYTACADPERGDRGPVPPPEKSQKYRFF